MSVLLVYGREQEPLAGDLSAADARLRIGDVEY
jgi:hypothetical protein